MYYIMISAIKPKSNDCKKNFTFKFFSFNKIQFLSLGILRLSTNGSQRNI